MEHLLTNLGLVWNVGISNDIFFSRNVIRNNTIPSGIGKNSRVLRHLSSNFEIVVLGEVMNVAQKENIVGEKKYIRL